MPTLQRALISVYDKTGVVEFATFLQQQGVEIISTGGTAKHLNENGIKTRSISEITGFPEILKGRVKTVHPKILGGLLALRDNSSHMDEVGIHDVDLIDLVVVNLYPFEDTIKKCCFSFHQMWYRKHIANLFSFSFLHPSQFYILIFLLTINIYFLFRVILWSFNQYSYLHNIGTRGEGGSGLGLIICKRFIELHGGEISVSSNIGTGSKFEFTIPRG